MKIKIKSIILGLVGILLVIPLHVEGATEGLDEVASRKSRLSSNTFYSGEAGSSYTWQPQSLSYTDVTTGKEVWRLTYNNRSNRYQDIGFSSWSANGDRFGYNVKGIKTDAFSSGSDDYIWFVMNTNGTLVRPVVNGPTRARRSFRQFFHWSPALPDVYYDFGTSSLGNTDVDSNVLYKVMVTDTSMSMKNLLNFGTGLKLYKSISADGTRVFALSSGEGRLYPATIYPETQAKVLVPGGFSLDLGQDTFWGNTPSTWSSLHDQYLSGSATTNIWFYVNPSNAQKGWWRIKLTDGTPTHIPDSSSPYNWGDVEPANTSSGGQKDPWCSSGRPAGVDCSGYWSHFVPDRWGTKALFTDSSNVGGVGVYDTRTNRFDMKGVALSYALHHSWSGWTDFVVSSNSLGSGSGSKIYLTDVFERFGSNSPKTLAVVNQVSSSRSCYDCIPRVGQSPDGTKASWHSEFLSGKIDLFYVVAYYPYPPEITGASKSGGNVRLTWDFRQTTSNPRTYTKRGWPNEDTDMPPSPREIEGFRIWRSSDNVNWEPVGETDYGNCAGDTAPCGEWIKTSWSYDIAQANNTIMYYGITSKEYSGLESRSLSNTWKIKVDGNGNVTGFPQSSYPPNPGNDGNFYTTSPEAPVSMAVAHQKAPAVALGQYSIEWSEPADPALIRHFNIYAQDGSSPTVDQTNLIASISREACQTGSCKWVDWLGNKDGSTKYIVTSVDTQGNESGKSQPGNNGPTPLPPPETTDPSASPSLSPAFVGEAGNIALNKSVQDSGIIYSGMNGSKAVDGIKGMNLNYWSGKGSPNWLVLDLGKDLFIDQIVARPYGFNDPNFYYNAEWNIQYSFDNILWHDFDSVVQVTGGGNLSGSGIHIVNGNPGPGNYENFKEYEFTFAKTQVRYLRFYVSKGDVDNDANLEEFEVFFNSKKVISPPLGLKVTVFR